MPYSAWKSRPRRRRFRRRFNRRFRRRRNYRRRGLNPSNKLKNFPSYRIAKLRYVQTLEMPPGGSSGQYFMAANSINQPDQTGTDVDRHRPLGYDQWNAFFSRYVVLRSTCKMSATFNTTPQDTVLVGIQLCDTTDPISSIGPMAVMEQGTSKIRTLQPASNGMAVQFDSPLFAFYSAKGWHEVADVADSDTLIARFNQDPVDLTYYRLFFVTQNGGTLATSPRVTVDITYTVLMLDQKSIPQSNLPEPEMQLNALRPLEKKIESKTIEPIPTDVKNDDPLQSEHSDSDTESDTENTDDDESDD